MTLLKAYFAAYLPDKTTTMWKRTDDCSAPEKPWLGPFYKTPTKRAPRALRLTCQAVQMR